jgi:hypothetical protein
MAEDKNEKNQNGIIGNVHTDPFVRQHLGFIPCF